jgi:hypothetical protein
VTTTFALTVDVFAFAIRQILQQIFQSAFTPIRQLDSGGHGLDFLDDTLTNEFGPVAFGSVQIRNSADVGATRAIFGTARFLIHVDMEASFSFLAFAASDTETAQTAFFGQFESGRSRDDGWDFAFVVQIAMVFETVDDIRHGEPQALTPVVRSVESWARLSFFDLDAFSAFFVRLIRMATALATTVFLDAIAFRHHF